MLQNTHLPARGSWKTSGLETIQTYCSALRMHYITTSDGQIAMLSRHGKFLHSFHFGADNAGSPRILGLISIHGPTMPLHIACMYHLSHLHSKLFILAHEMVDHEPENPVSWYAVGVWYLCRGKWAQARQYFRWASPVTGKNQTF